MEHIGPSRPAPLTHALPPALAALVAAHGSGVLGGSLRLAPPGAPEHEALVARFEAERARRAGSSDWLMLRSKRGSRSIVIGEGLGNAAGSFVFFDPHAHLPATALWIVCENGEVAEPGDDVEALSRALKRGVLSMARPPKWLDDAFTADADLLDVPGSYDTRDDDTAAFAAALANDDETAADAAFEIFAAMRSLPRRLVEGRALVSAASTDCARSYQKQLERMATRNPIALRFGEVPRRTPVPVLASLEAIGFQPGGELDERLARAIDGEAPIDVASLGDALARTSVLGEQERAVRDGLGRIHAIDALAWLAAVRVGRVGGRPLRDMEPIPLEWLAPLETCWPVLALALLEGVSFRWAAPHVVTLLGELAHPAVRPIFLTLLVSSPSAFGNQSASIAADFCLRDVPATAAQASAWIASIRARGPVPKRHEDYDAEAAAVLELLVRSVALPEVAKFFATDAMRNPYAAFAAAKRASPAAGRDILRAIYTSRAYVSLKLSACELAVERGDGEARAQLPAIQKAASAEGRRLDRM